MLEAEFEDFCRILELNPETLKVSSLKQPLPIYRAIFSYLMFPRFRQKDIADLLTLSRSNIACSIQMIRKSLSIKDRFIIGIFEKLNIEIDYKLVESPDLTELSRKVYFANTIKGFHPHKHSDKHHLCMIVGELMEAIEADRKGLRADLVKFSLTQDDVPDKTSFKLLFEKYIKDSVEDELADVIIRLLDFAGARKYILSDIPYNTKQNANSLLTESIWDVITELVVCEDEKGVYCAIKMIESLCKVYKIDIWKHVELKIRYNKTRPYRHNKLY